MYATALLSIIEKYCARLWNRYTAGGGFINWNFESQCDKHETCEDSPFEEKREMNYEPGRWKQQLTGAGSVIASLYVVQYVHRWVGQQMTRYVLEAYKSPHSQDSEGTSVNHCSWGHSSYPCSRFAAKTVSRKNSSSRQESTHGREYCKNSELGRPCP
jgi:hypothetical protein